MKPSTHLKRILLTVMPLIFSLFCLPQGAPAAPGDEIFRFDNPDPNPYDRFGAAVAVLTNGDLLIGASEDDTGATQAGSAYVIDETTGALLLTLNNPDPAWGDHFGFSVAALPSGDLAVGALADDAGAKDAGSVYIFDGTNGNLLRTLHNPTPSDFDKFGHAVASLPNGDLLISAPLDDVGAFNSGAAYLIDGNNGTLLRTLKSPIVTAYEQFGIAVASMPNGDVLVGASGVSGTGGSPGSVYLFDGTSGVLLLTLRNPTSGDSFGRSVVSTPSGDVLVGAYNDGLGGAAYLFDGTTGAHLLTLNNPNPPDTAEFGFSLASLANGDLLVGAFGSDIGAQKAGTAYLFDGITGDLLLTLDNPTPATTEYFGTSVASMPDGRLLVGAQYDDAVVDGAGAVYLFEGVPSTPGPTPVSKWPFDENSGCIASDSVGTNDGNLQPLCPGNAPAWSLGKVGSALDFDGTDDVVQVEADAYLQPAQITVATWVRPDTLGNWDTVLMNASTSAWADGYGLYYNSNAGGMSFYINHYTTRVAGPINTGNWSHVAATYDEAEIKIYIDGALVDTLAYAEPIHYPDPTASLLIGKGQGGTTAYGWDGALDEAQIFDSALSLAEIQALCGQCQDTTPEVTSVWTFDENTGCTAADGASTNDGLLGPSCSGNAPNWTLGKVGSALDFDGVDDVVTVAADASLQPARLTVMAWVYPDDLGQWDAVLMNATTVGWADGYGIYYNSNTGINFFVNHYSGARVYAAISPGVWTHVAGTYDGAEIKLYLDGVLVDTLTYSQPINYPSPSSPLLIGKGFGSATSYVWEGSLDELRLGDGALSAAEIQDIYNQGMSQ